ncbi:MAG: class I peptide chain release factor [Deltaproteobacteria bacterium RIFCSPLOWO2_02_FULL_53_8]|nr:MAG: class I peptide chain release factor [Deltaproteobacteria bacterium RIFCSPLOWO2_02_FULL_53_8]
MIHVTGDIFIDESEIQEEFVRSGGPGGQHVNKVSTAVQLRFNVIGSRLPQDVKTRLIRLAGKKVTDDGVVLISSRESRSRETNRAEALEKLLSLIKKATIAPKRRLKTRPTFSAKQKRVDEKKVRGGAKKMRKKVGGED